MWGWLIGPFVSAHLRVYRDPVLARSFLAPLIQELDAHGVDSLGDIFDGDPPHTPRGCIAQAWAVSEVVGAWNESATRCARVSASHLHSIIMAELTAQQSYSRILSGQSS